MDIRTSANTITESIAGCESLSRTLPAGLNRDKINLLQQGFLDLNGIMNALSDIQQEEESRHRITTARQTIRAITRAAEDLRTEIAGQYRLTLGEGKDVFESLPEQQQSITNPEAHRLRQAFARLGDMQDRLSLIQSHLLDLEGKVEHETMRRTSDKSIGEAPEFDTDPAPSSLHP